MTTIGLLDERLSGSVIGAFFEVYNALGHGFLEHIYKAALERELVARGHHVAREVGVIVYYKGEELAKQRLDMLVDDRLIIEVKASTDGADVGSAQLFNYLRATNLELGLLLSFGRKAFFKRVICSNSSSSTRRARVGRKSDAESDSAPANEVSTLKRNNG